jgi:SAM-dependent methyltransferase
MPVHEVAASGFDAEAEVYERSRPSYPPEAVRWLADRLEIAPGRTVLDLAAGTGKLTRLLEPLDATLLAAEPVAGMRAQLRRVCPAVPVVAAGAEALPFAAGTLDAIVVAQAFHWFDADAALQEAHRTLAAGGRLGLVWNARDRTADHVDRLWSIMDRVEKRAPWRDHEQWRDSAAYLDTPWFTPMVEATFHHEQQLSPDDVIARFRSVSHVAVLPSREQEAILAEVRAVLDEHPDTRGRELVSIPYRVDAFATERRA